MRLIIGLLTLFFSLSLVAKELTNTELNKQATQRINDYGKQLKTTLKKAVSTSGFVAGVQACQLAVPSINKQHNNEHWKIARTSLKVRNISNSPDAWELAQLQEFEKQKAAGVNIKQLQASTTIVHKDGKKEFRFIKAIATQKICLSCHGENIEPEIRKTITESYPNDQAIGFRLGDIRGAFTATKSIF